MKTKQVQNKSYCEGCRLYIEFKCEVFDQKPDEQNKALCNLMGFRDIKTSYSSVRIYNNRQGAPDNDDI